MADGPESILGALARTALLVGISGIALYLALAAFSQNVPAAHLWLVLLLGSAALILFGTSLFGALRTGRMASRGGEISARANPILFGMMLVLLLAAIPALLVLLAWAGWGLLR